MADDIRLRDIIQPGNTGDVVLLGFPHDSGVELNGGRPGARHGPDRFRQWMGRYGASYNPELEIDLNALSITDAGNVSANLPLPEAHRELTRVVGEILENGGIPFVIGGGHDLSYPNVSALLDRHPACTVGAINIDAHLDVRPLIDGQAHSGSSFRQLIEDNRFSGDQFIEFAAQGAQSSRQHAEFVTQHKGRIFWLTEVSKTDTVAAAFHAALGKLAWKCESLFISLDLDAIRASDAPGVSCPGVRGLRAGEAMDIALAAGKHPQVDLFDLAEYNPLVEAERTGRLAVAIFYYFCLGVAWRKGRA